MAVFWLSVAGPGVRTGVSLVALPAGGHGQTWTRDPDKMPVDWLTPVRREGDGAACPRCGLTLRRKLFGKRAAFFCSACQK